MSLPRVLVLLGADSPERDVSLRSGKAVVEAVERARYPVTTYDPIDGAGSLEQAVQQADVVLPILHGINGEDGTIQAHLEKLQVRFLGSTSKVSEICFDKFKTHEVLEAAGIHMPRSKIVTIEELNDEMFSEPFVLKPVGGGSSVDTLVCREHNEDTLETAKNLLLAHEQMLLEELIEGTEITVAVLGSEALPVIVIRPPQGAEFDYENKYNGATEEICPVPEDLVSSELQTQARDLALKVHNLLGARHLSRVDMFISNTGELVVLELNTMPGMTEQSLFPKSAQAAGYDMVKLVEKLIELSMS